MKMILSNSELLPELRAKLKNQIDFVNREIRDLSPDTLNFRPAKGRWSVLECIEHLNMLFDVYMPRVKKAVERTTKKSESYTTGFFGDRMVTAMEPTNNKIKNPMRTFRNMKPERSKRNSANIIKQFNQYMSEFEELISKSDDLDLGQRKVTSAIGSILRFKLGDCYRFLLAHNERHMLQCQKVLRVLASYQ